MAGVQPRDGNHCGNHDWEGLVLTLIQRLAHAEVYDLGGRRRRLLTGGSIRNVVPFDEGGVLTPAELLIASADRVATDQYRLRKNGVGIEVDLAAGDIAVNAVPGYWADKRLVFRTGISLQWRQVRDRYIELYRDTPTVRYSFVLWDRGFKFNFFVKPGYSGGGEFRIPYILQGLTRQGRRIVETSTGKSYLRLQDPFIIPLRDVGGSYEELIGHELQAIGHPKDCIEQDVAGEFVIQADLTGFGSDYDACYIDPSISFDEDDGWKDSPIVHYYPHNNVGLCQYDWACSWNLGTDHTYLTAVEIDTTAIPAGAVIDSATLNRKVYAATNVDMSAFTEYLVNLLEDFGEGNNLHWYDRAGAGESDWNDNFHAQSSWKSRPDVYSAKAMPRNDGLTYGAEVASQYPTCTYAERNPNRYSGQGAHTWKQLEVKTAVQYAADNSQPTRWMWGVEPFRGPGRRDWYYESHHSIYAGDRPYLDVVYDVGTGGGKNKFQVAGVGRRRSFSAVPESQAIGKMRRVFHG
jgi:hypothetical protein